MKRWIPAPWLSVALWLLWLLLNQPLGIADLLLGALLALLAPLLLAPLRPLPMRAAPGKTLLVGLRLAPQVLLDMLVSNAQVAHSVLTARRRPPRSAFVRVPLALRDPNGLAILAVLTTLIPGTVWSELALDRSILLLHVLDLDDEAAFIAHYKARYEQPLLEIFQ